MAKTLIQNVKDLKISSPCALGLMSLKLKSNVIVVAKFDFQAESKEELTISKGDVLKLLDRFSNGWVLVKFIDKVHPPGVVPCLYVDIALNDPINPITLKWLHQETNANSGAFRSFVDAQVQSLLADNGPLTINNMPYPLTASVSHYLTFEDRFWYRVDVTYSTGEQGYLCRYYQDFYDLHAALLEMCSGLSEKEVLELGKLPKLPEPMPSKKRDSTEQQEIFSERCRQLSTYMSELVQNKNYQVSLTLVDWIDKDYSERPGFVVDDALNDTHEVINQLILEGSVTLASKSKLEKVPSPEIKKVEPFVKPQVPIGMELKRSKSKNIYNHYQQAASWGQNAPLGRSASTHVPLRARSQKRNVSDSAIGRSKTITAVTAGQSMDIQTKPPKTPNLSNGGDTTSLSPHTPLGPLPHIKCKIKTQSNDILVIKIDKKQFTTLDDFKNIIYQKVAFNNLFIKLPQSASFMEIESPEIGSLKFLHLSDRVLLLVT